MKKNLSGFFQVKSNILGNENVHPRKIGSPCNQLITGSRVTVLLDLHVRPQDRVLCPTEWPSGVPKSVARCQSLQSVLVRRRRARRRVSRATTTRRRRHSTEQRVSIVASQPAHTKRVLKRDFCFS